MLLKWKQKDGPAASYEYLAQALQHPILGKSELATKYCHSFRETGESRFCVTQFNLLIILVLNEVYLSHTPKDLPAQDARP